MQPGPITVARLRKAIRHRLNRLQRQAASQTPVSVKQFASISDLRRHAIATTSTGNRFAYEVSLATGATGLGPLKIGRIAKLEVKATSDKLTVSASFTEAIAEGAFAWAVATMLQPGLRPLACHSPDIAATSLPDPALLMGQRPHFGEFSGSDASEMESSQARRFEPADAASPYFDLATFNPIGLRLREQATRPSIAEITVGRSVSVSGREYPNDERLPVALRDFTGANLVCTSDADAGLVAALAATGLVITTTTPPASLHPELAELLRQPLPAAGADAETTINWMVRSEQQRRAAIRHHAGAFRLQSGWPAASVLLVTNRVGMLPAAVEQIAAQNYPEFEVLVGLHGIPSESARSALTAQTARLGDRIRLIEFDTSLTLGAIYGRLTEMANGLYLAKFDDDDFYGPNHLWDAITAMRYSGAGLFGRTPTMTWLDSTGELLLRPFGAEEVYNKYIIGATMVIDKAALIEVGGWRPSPWAVDKALIDRFQNGGGGIYRAGQLGWVYVRHDQGHTWLRDESHFRNQAEAVWSGDEALRLRNLVLQA